jgi:hypothetical protein
VDVITDWDAGDKIVLCGEGKLKFWVNEITYVDYNPSDFDYEIDDVAIVLSNGAAIYVLNAKADFVAGDAPLGDNGYLETVNPDDFARVATCDPTCVVPPVVVETVPEPEWFFG